VTKWLKIDQDNLRMIFSALNANFSSQGANDLGLTHFCSNYFVIYCRSACSIFGTVGIKGLRTPVQVGIKDEYPPPLKSGYFTAIGSFSVKTIADRQRYTAYYNKH